jgi:hypothetical protein
VEQAIAQLGQRLVLRRWRGLRDGSVTSSAPLVRCCAACCCTPRHGAADPHLDRWAWHVIDALRQQAARNPSDRLAALVAELEGLVPDRPRPPGPEHLGFAVPLRLSSGDGELQLLTTLTHSETAVDVTVAELRLEAFLPPTRRPPPSSPTWGGRHHGEAEPRSSTLRTSSYAAAPQQRVRSQRSSRSHARPGLLVQPLHVRHAEHHGHPD